MQSGSLVRWWDTYSEGISKSSGLGIVMNIHKHVFAEPSYSGQRSYESVEVWRFHPYNDLRVFNTNSVENIKEENEIG